MINIILQFENHIVQITNNKNKLFDKLYKMNII